MLHSCLVYLDVFARENGRVDVSEGEGLEQLKRLLIQLPVDNFNVLKYIRYVCVCVLHCIYACSDLEGVLCSRFLHEVEQCSEENKMNCVNLGTIFGPHLLRPQTEDPHILMECNSVSTNFVRALITYLQELFPPTLDERAPKRLSIVFQPDDVPPWLKQSTESPLSPHKLDQRSLYQAKGRHKFRPRQNSAPPSNKGICELACTCGGLILQWCSTVV